MGSPETTLRTWLTPERALYIWAAIVAGCVAWQPLLLGFYLDDWQELVYASTRGTPFSIPRFLFLNTVDPTRPGLMPVRFIYSSLFGAHPLPHQAALLLVNCCVALSIVAACRALIQCRTPMDKAVTAAMGLCWLLLPWNAAARYWPSLLPNVVTIGVEGFLCVYLIQGWNKNESRAVSAGALYLWMCLSYEAFYFQWIPLALIGVALWRAKRAALKPVLASSAALLAAQIAALLWSVHARNAGYERAKDVIPHWAAWTWTNLGKLEPEVRRSVGELSKEFVLFEIIVAAAWLFVLVRSFRRDSERPAASASAALAGIAVLGGLISIVVFSLGGRMITGVGVETRSTILFNFWILIAAAILTTFAMDRLRRMPKLIFAVGLAGAGLCLGACQILRAEDWITAWDQQKKILAEAPAAELRRVEPDARILIVNPIWLNGAPIFSAKWDVNEAIPWTYPFLRNCRFLVYNPEEGVMTWNGKELSTARGSTHETVDIVYLWRPSEQTFWRARGPFAVNPDLTVQEFP